MAPGLSPGLFLYPGRDPGQGFSYVHLKCISAVLSGFLWPGMVPYAGYNRPKLGRFWPFPGHSRPCQPGRLELDASRVFQFLAPSGLAGTQPAKKQVKK